MAEGVIALLQNSLEPLADLLGEQALGYEFPFATFVDEGIYRGSNIRMITQCRESEQHASTDRKCAIQMGGEFIRSQRHLLVSNQCKVSAQLPHRALISCIQRNSSHADSLPRAHPSLIPRTKSVNCPFPQKRSKLLFLVSESSAFRFKSAPASRAGCSEPYSKTERVTARFARPTRYLEVI